MEYKAFIAGLIVFAFLFYGIFLFFMIRRWRAKKETISTWEEGERLQREKFLKELLAERGTSEEGEKISLRKGEKNAECPHCGTRQKILENAISFVCKECGGWVNIEK